MIMKKIYLFGTNSVAQILAIWLAADSRYKLLGFAINEVYLKDTELKGFPVVALESIRFDSENVFLINCVGYSSQLEGRKKSHNALCKLPLETYIHPNAIVSGSEIGRGSIVMANAVVEPGSTLGAGNVVYGGVYICHDAKIGDFNWFSAGCVMAGYCNVGNRNFFGINTSIRERITIGSKNTIGASTVVIKDIADNYTVVGNPGRILRRNEK